MWPKKLLPPKPSGKRKRRIKAFFYGYCVPAGEAVQLLRQALSIFETIKFLVVTLCTMVKNLLFYCTFVPFTVVLALVIMPAGLLKWQRLCRAIHSFWGRGALFLAGVRLEADLSVLAPVGSRGQVITANHKSLFDIPVLFSIFRDRDLVFVAKKSLFGIPFFGWAMTACGHISVDRSNRRQAMQSVKDAAHKIDQGVSILVFPEGTRSKDADELGGFQMGAIIMAIQCKTGLQPMLIDGSYKIMPPGSLKLAPGRHVVRVKALKTVDTSTYTLKQREALKDDLVLVMKTGFAGLRHE